MAASPRVPAPAHGMPAAAMPAHAVADPAPLQPAPAAVPLPVAAPAAAAQPAAPDLLPACETARAGVGQARPAADAAFAHPFVPSGSQGLRVSEASSLQAADLIQLQARVEALKAAGDVDAAIGLLRQHLDAHPQASALGWLSLLDVLHAQGRVAEYEQLRHDYEWLFNTKAPAFDAWPPGGAGLQAHPATLAAISAQWPGPAALARIGDAMFKRPAGADDAFDLESYRDLLLLQAVGQDLVAHPASSADPAAVPVSATTDVAALAPALAPVLAAAALSPAPSMPELPDLDFSLPAPVLKAGPLADDPEAGHILDLGSLELDLNLDELDPGAAPPAAADATLNSNLLDFDLDLGDSYPLPQGKR